MFKRILLQKDTWIESNYPYKNNGINNQLYCFKQIKDSSGFYNLNQENEARSLIYFDEQNIKAELSKHGKTLSDPDVKIEIQFVISNWLTDSENFDIKAFPLTKPFYENYGNDVNSITDGANWISSDMSTEWDNEGGDYTDTYTDINVILDKENMMMTLDVTQFLIDYDGSNNGVILIPEGSVRNFAFYSSNSDYAVPYINIFFDDYSIQPDANNVPFDIHQIPVIKTNLSKHEYLSSEILRLQLIVLSKYSRESFEISNKVAFLPNIKYRIIDKTRGRLINDFRDETRVPVTDRGNSLKLHLMNLLEGFYRLEFIYENALKDIVTTTYCDFRINN